MCYTRRSLLNKQVLITGSSGQISSELIPELTARGYSIIATDVKLPKTEFEYEVFEILDVRQKKEMERLVSKYDISLIIHNASILSAKGEQDPSLALDVNFEGTRNVLEVARDAEVEKVFSPSSIAAFGPETPKENTPNDVITRPKTIYGISKVFTELLGEYFWGKYQLDFRCLRYPGIITPNSIPSGGTTDWAIEMFFEALNNGNYRCFVNKDTQLPMMSMRDCVRGTLEFLEVDSKKLTHRTYNVTGISFTPAELYNEIKTHLPSLKIEYLPDYRQQIADTWPKSIDDNFARRDWGWQNSDDLKSITKWMIDSLKSK